MNEPGAIVWITGRPASGKSTLAAAVRERLGPACVLLDSDDVRRALVPPPAFDAQSRDYFYTTLGNLALLLARQGHTVLVPATAHRRAWRDRIRAEAPRFVEVHVRADPSLCASRDPKGLYARAAAGELRSLPGIDATYEEPLAPEVVADGNDVDEAVQAVIDAL